MPPPSEKRLGVGTTTVTKREFSSSAGGQVPRKESFGVSACTGRGIRPIQGPSSTISHKVFFIFYRNRRLSPHPREIQPVDSGNKKTKFEGSTEVASRTMIHGSCSCGGTCHQTGARARGSKARARTGQNLIDHLLISFNFPFSSLCLLILPSFDFSLFGQTRLFEIPPIQVVFIPSSSYHRHHQYHLSLCPVRRPSTQLQPPRSQPIARPLLLQYPPPPNNKRRPVQTRASLPTTPVRLRKLITLETPRCEMSCDPHVLSCCVMDCIAHCPNLGNKVVKFQKPPGWNTAPVKKKRERQLDRFTPLLDRLSYYLLPSHGCTVVALRTVSEIVGRK